MDGMARAILSLSEERFKVARSIMLSGGRAEQVKLAFRNHGWVVSDPTISKYMGKVREYQRSIITPDDKVRAERVAFEIDVLSNIRNLAMMSFERSLMDSVTVEESEDREMGIPMRTIGDMGQQPMDRMPGVSQTLTDMMGLPAQIAKTKQIRRVKTVGQSGDPRFLETALHASESIRKVLGIDPVEVKRLEIVNKNVDDISLDELRKLPADELARILDQEIDQAKNIK